MARVKFLGKNNVKSLNVQTCKLAPLCVHIYDLIIRQIYSNRPNMQRRRKRTPHKSWNARKSDRHGGETGERARQWHHRRITERERSSAKRKCAMQIREIQNICKSREAEPHENRSGFKRDEEGGGEGREGDGAGLPTSSSPLKFNPVFFSGQI